MAGLKQYYSVDDKPYSGADVVPAGNYCVKLIAGRMRNTKDMTGEYAEIRMIVLDGEYAGCVIIDRMNLKNASPEAERIGRQQFAALREVTGVNEPHDFMDMAGIRFIINVSCDKWQDNPERWSNKVRRYMKHDDNTTPPAQRNTPKAAPSSDDIPPWAA